MPYREKTAWLSLLAMAVTFGPYFTMVATRSVPLGPMPNLRLLGWFAVTAVVQMLILGAGHLYLRRGSVPEDRMPLDERDQAGVHRRAPRTPRRAGREPRRRDPAHRGRRALARTSATVG